MRQPGVGIIPADAAARSTGFLSYTNLLRASRHSADSVRLKRPIP